MKKLFLILMLIPALLFGQNEPKAKIDSAKNNIYAEFHPGLFTRLVMNYERQIYSGKKVSCYGRLGGGIAGILGPIVEMEILAGWGGLGAITILTGKKNNHFELNTGALIGLHEDIIGEYNDIFIFPLFNIGYRYQKPRGGFIFRLNAGIYSFGLSLGYAF